MSTYVLRIDKTRKPKDYLKFLDDNQPQKGDKVKLVSEGKTENAVGLIAVVALLAIAFAYYFHKKKKHEDNTAKILEDLFKDYASAEEYEKHIEEEFGIKVEHEQEDGNEWFAISSLALESAYSEDEPDISQIQLKEPNPLYNRQS